LACGEFGAGVPAIAESHDGDFFFWKSTCDGTQVVAKPSARFTISLIVFPENGLAPILHKKSVLQVSAAVRISFL